MAEPTYDTKDIVVWDSPPGYDADPTPGIILEVLDERAGEFNVRDDDTTRTIDTQYGDKVSESDYVYRVRDLYLTDGEAVPGDSTYYIPEGAIEYRKD